MSRRRIAVLGSGAWGTALANLAARAGADVTLWARDGAHVAEMTATGVNARRLPGIPLLSNVTPVSDLSEAAGAAFVLAAVPTQSLRTVLERAAPTLAAGIPIVVCAKGIETGTGLFVTEIAGAVLPESPAAILSGPSFAEDVAKGLPTAVTLAAPTAALAESLAVALTAPWFRLYHSTDVRGVEIGGAAKNVLAIASGIAEGRGLGASAGAALLARGFAELGRFGRAYGAEAETLAGLSGLGDLVLTCTSIQSRNFALGRALGRGIALAEATGGRLVEGASTCEVLVSMARAKGVEMPIAEAVAAVLSGAIGVDAAIEALLSRPSRAETAVVAV